MIWAILWLVVAIIINVQLAQKKERSVGGWIVGAILIGLFSSLILFILPTKAPMKKCPYCLSTIPAAAIRCSKCQADLSSWKTFNQ